MWIDRNPYRVTYERDPDSPGYIFYIHDLVDVPDHWGLLIGDFVHNLRSVLDYLAYQLAILGQQRPLTEDEARRVSFPVFTSEGEFRNRGAKRIELLRASEQTRVKELQPFNTWNTDIWGSLWNTPAVLPRTLREISILDNVDKHRSIHPTFQAIDVFGERQEGFSFPAPDATSMTIDPLEEGAEIGRWHYSEVAALPDISQVDVKRYFPLGIQISEGAPIAASGPGGVVLSTAMEMFDWHLEAVAKVLWLFIPCFTHGAPPRSVTQAI